MVLNKSVTEDTVKYFSRMSHKLVHSTNICFVVCWFAASCESSEESVVASCSSSVASASVQVCENEDEERGEG